MIFQAKYDLKNIARDFVEGFLRKTMQEKQYTTLYMCIVERYFINSKKQDKQKIEMQVQPRRTWSIHVARATRATSTRTPTV